MLFLFKIFLVVNVGRHNILGVTILTSNIYRLCVLKFIPMDGKKKEMKKISLLWPNR